MILIVEDQQVFQELYSLILNKLGHPSTLAVDGQEALEKAQAHEPALVFMDIQMPVMDGYKTAENLRKRGFNKPIIAVTASDSSDEWELCRKAGIDDLLIKPIRPGDVEKMINKWTGTPREAPAPEAVGLPSVSDGVFDSADMLDTFMNNEEMALSLLARFIERTQGQLESMPDLEKNGDWESARRLAHTIRGAAFTMGGAELGNAATRLELAYKDQSKDEMEAAFPPLQEAFERYKKEAEEFISSRS